MEEETPTKTEPGICPVCGSDDINYQDPDFVDGDLYYQCYCSNCSTGFEEWYNLSYAETVID